MELTVTKILVLQGPGPDKIFVHTTLPSAFPPMPGVVALETLVLRFDAAQDTGQEYVQRVFECEPEVIRC